MTEEEIISNVRKGISFLQKGTYDNPEDLVGHIMQIIRYEQQELRNKVTLTKHNLEKLLHLIEEYRQASIDIKNGHKKKIGYRTNIGKAIDKAIIKLHSLGYNTERFKEKYKTVQNELFNG